MRILVFGPGVIGSIFAGKLAQSPCHQVEVAARGRRLAAIREHGLQLRDLDDIVEHDVRIEVYERPDPAVRYDLVIAALRADQVDAALPTLAALPGDGDIVVMANNPLGYASWSAALGKRLAIGFPGAAGFIRDDVVHYRIVHPWLQATTLGEIDGAITPRLRGLLGAFNRVGIPTRLSRNIDAWQKYHVAWVAPLAAAIYLAQADGAPLAEKPALQRLMIAAMNEGTTALRAMGVPPTPAKMNLLRWTPAQWQAAILRPVTRTKFFADLAVPHSLTATDEIRLLARQFMELIDAAPVTTLHLRELYGSFIV